MILVERDGFTLAHGQHVSSLFEGKVVDLMGKPGQQSCLDATCQQGQKLIVKIRGVGVVVFQQHTQPGE